MGASIAGLCILALALMGRWRWSLIVGLWYAVLFGLILVLTDRPIGRGALGGIVLLAATYSLPIALALVVYASTTVSELLAGLRAMRLPELVIIPIAVMFRFFPTVITEGRAITEALRLRHGSSWGNPLRTIERILVPLVVSVLRIGEELTASALTRGLGARLERSGDPAGRRIRPTTITRIGFRPVDLVWLAVGTIPILVALTMPGLRA